MLREFQQSTGYELGAKAVRCLQMQRAIDVARAASTSRARGKLIAELASNLQMGHERRHTSSTLFSPAIVNDPLVHPATRAHFRATTQLGSGMVLSIDLIDNTTELSDGEWTTPDY